MLRWSTVGALASLSTTAAALALPVYLLWFFHQIFWPKGFGYDEQFFTWCGWSVTKGLAPYKDFLEYKPPFLFLTHALAIKTFGFEHLRFRIFFILINAIGISTLQLAVISRGANKAITCALACAAVFLLAQPSFHDSSLADAESTGYAYYMIGAGCLLARTRFRKLTDILGGAFMALCFFSKEPFAPCILSTWLAAYLATNGPRRFTKTFPRYFAFTGIGVAVVVVALCIYMVPTGAMSAYISTLLSYKKLFRDPTKSYCVLLGTFQPTGSFFGDLPGQWKIIHDSFFNVKTLGFLAPAFVASAVFLARRSIVLLLAGLLTIFGALYTVTVSNCFWPHYYVMAQTGIFFFLFLGADAATGALRKSPRSVRVWSGLVFLATLGGPIWLRYDTENEAWTKNGPPKPPNTYDEPIPGVVEFVRTHSSPDDRIFTTGAPGLYIATDRVQATRVSTFMDELLPALPGDTDEEKLADRRQELTRNRPKIIILDPEHANRKARHYKALFEPFIREHKYEKVGDYFYVRPY